MLPYKFKINTYDVDITAKTNNDYHVSLDGVFAGIVFSEFTEGIVIWKTKDLIPEDLVQKIGTAIEKEKQAD